MHFWDDLFTQLLQEVLQDDVTVKTCLKWVWRMLSKYSSPIYKINSRPFEVFEEESLLCFVLQCDALTHYKVYTIILPTGPVCAHVWARVSLSRKHLCKLLNIPTHRMFVHTGHSRSPRCKHTAPWRMCRKAALFQEVKNEGENKETTHYWTPPSSDPLKEWEAERGQKKKPVSKRGQKGKVTENKDYKNT